MIRMTLASIAMSMLIAAAPALAQTTTSTMSCKDEMTKAEPMAQSMTDKTKQASAMKEIDLAKEMMAKNDEAGCKTHMQHAMDLMK